MKVLHIAETLDGLAGGIPYAVFNILKIEHLIGIESHVLSVSGEYKVTNIDKNIKVHMFNISFPKRFTNSKKAIQWLKQEVTEFDCLVVHSTWNILCQKCAHIAFKNDIPYVVWPHGSLDPFDLKKKRLLKQILGGLFVSRFLKNASSVCVTSREELNMLHTFGTNPEVSILPIPVYLNESNGDPKRFRERYGFSNDDFVLLFLSRINYKKGIDILVKAIYLLKNDNKKVKLLIAGGDSNGYLKQINKLIEDLELNGEIKYVGMLENEDKADAFLGSDCFVLPSLNENYGIAVVESLLYGLPVIISDNVYIFREIIDDNGGWVCKAESGSVKSAITHILDNKADLASKKNSAINAGKRYTAVNLIPLYKKFYTNITSNDFRKDI